MPSIASKKQEAVLSWDAFPEPPPEAANWKPDPECIARPGVFRDPRFNKDPQAERKRAAMERERQFRGYTSNLKDSSRSSRPSVNPAGQATSPRNVPTPTIQSINPTTTVNPQRSPTLIAAAPSPVSAATVSPNSSTSTHGQALQAHGSSSVCTETHATLSENCTMKKSLGMAMEYDHTRPLASPSFQPQLACIDKTIMPPWTGPLEKLLAEGMAHEQPSSAELVATSMPPHKRKSVTAEPDPLDLDVQFQVASEASRRVSSTSASETVISDEAGIKNVKIAAKSLTRNFFLVKEDLALHGHRDTKASHGSAEYERSLSIGLVKYMEGELDLGSHGTKAELRALDDRVFKMYFDKVQAAHKQLWLAENLKEK